MRDSFPGARRHAPRWWQPHWLRGGSLIAAGLLLLLLPHAGGGSETMQPLLCRPFDGRLAGQQAYAPYERDCGRRNAAPNGAMRGGTEASVAAADAAVVHLARAADDPVELAHAIGAAAAAYQRMPRSPEAAWNRAVVLEAASWLKSNEAWDDYLRLDPGSEWAAEARRRRAALRAAQPARPWDHERDRLAAAAVAGDDATVHAIVNSGLSLFASRRESS